MWDWLRSWPTQRRLFERMARRSTYPATHPGKQNFTVFTLLSSLTPRSSYCSLCSLRATISIRGVSIQSRHYLGTTQLTTLIRTKRLQRCTVQHSHAQSQCIPLLDSADFWVHVPRILCPRSTAVQASNSCVCWLGRCNIDGLRCSRMGL